MKKLILFLLIIVPLLVNAQVGTDTLVQMSVNGKEIYRTQAQFFQANEATSGSGILNGGNAGVVTIGSNDNTLNLEAGGTTWNIITSTGNHTVTIDDNISNGYVMAIEGGGGNVLTVNTTNGAEITSIGTTSIGSVLTLGSERTVINGSQGIALRTISASGASGIANGDFHIRLDATTGAKTLTLPTPTYNMVLQFFRFDNNPATVITFTGTINGSVNPTTTGTNSPVGLLANQYSVLELKYNGTSWEVNTGTGDILNNGNAGAVVIGSNSSTMAIESNGTTRLSFGSTGDVTSTIPDNTTGAWLVNSSDGQGFVTVNTTNAAPRMILGSAESGAAIGQQGIRYEDVQAISASGAFTATKSTITLNLSSTGTVDANLTGWPTSASVASELVLINIHPTSSVTVDVTGAGWSGTSPIIAPGGTVTAKLINGTLYR